jgi:hypothetical protein
MSINLAMDAGIDSATGAALAICAGAGAGNEAANVSAIVVVILSACFTCYERRRECRKKCVSPKFRLGFVSISFERCSLNV